MPNATPPAEDTGDAGDARQRRIEALRALARGQQQLESPPAAMPPGRNKPPMQRKPRRTRWLVAGTSIICVVVIGALMLRGLLAPPARHAATTQSRLDLTVVVCWGTELQQAPF